MMSTPSSDASIAPPAPRVDTDAEGPARDEETWDRLPPPRGDARVVVLMSGGVDSAVAAALLRDAGYAPRALTLRLAGDGDDECARAQAVAQRLGMPWDVLDLRDLFRERVLAPFVAAYLDGRTPSPCVDCNPVVKLGASAAFARERWGIERLATGHYARVVHDREGGARLARAADRRRDQSYFLYRVPSDAWARWMFPLGAAPGKDAVRARARTLDLPPADHNDSMDLCFLPGGDYRTLLPSPEEAPTAEALRPGDMVDGTGRVVGTHPGCAYFTYGQRKGLGAHAGPRYVTGLDPSRHRVTIGERSATLRRTVHAVRAMYAENTPPLPGRRVGGRIRSGGEPHPCVVVAATGERLTVRFDESRFAPAPGQHLVLYDGSMVLGGGEIAGAEVE